MKIIWNPTFSSLMIKASSASAELSDLIRETEDEAETKIDVTPDKCQHRKNEENKFKKLRMKKNRSWAWNTNTGC